MAEPKLVGRIRWAPWQRFTVGLAARIVPAWRSATLIVQPATTTTTAARHEGAD